MRQESCRKCGFELKPKEKCEICKEPNRFVCKNCHSETEEQIHMQCRLIDMDHKILGMEMHVV